MDEHDPRDIILWLLPHKGEGFDGAAFATAKPENKTRFVAARHDPPTGDGLSREERAGTEIPVEYGLFDTTDRLAFLFSHGARTSVGVVGGCGRNADFLLPNMPGVSQYHFAITFDAQNMPIVKDLGSTGGTKITYNGEKGQRLSNFDWPLMGPSIAGSAPPILNITDRLQFKVIMPSHDYTSPEHIDKVKQFRIGNGSHDSPFASLLIQSAQGTRLPSKQQTPTRGPHARHVLYKKQIGKGAYGVVIYVWDVTTREEYVVKKPLPGHIKSRTFSERMWRQEADIMQKLSHKHIVAFRKSTFSPYPKLEFEYICGGSLENYANLSIYESTQVLCQLSSALEYLHNQNPSIGHRDIKIENILVVHRTDTNGIFVKFADFGLSKAADVLKTCCGTLFWAAPEIYSKLADPAGTAKETYGVAIDIWSLGAVVASLECGRPNYKDEWATHPVAWIHAFQKHVIGSYNEKNKHLLHLKVDNMLVEDPDERSSADYVAEEAAKLLESMVQGSDSEGTATPKTPSTIDSYSDTASEQLHRHDRDESSANGGEAQVEGSISSETQPVTARRSHILETTEIVPWRSNIDDSLWNYSGPTGATFTSEDDCQAVNRGVAEAERCAKNGQATDDGALLVTNQFSADHRLERRNAHDAVLVPEETRRKRGQPGDESPLPLLRPSTGPSLQHHNPKRGRTGI